MSEKKYSRKNFLKIGGLATLAGGLFACIHYGKGVPLYFFSKAVANGINRIVHQSSIKPSDCLEHDLIKTIDVKEDDMILDVGCGELAYLDLENRVYNIVGLDIPRFMLNRARKKKAILVQGDARDLPFEDNSFDGVISKDLLQYVSGYEKSVEEMYRVVKPGKKIAIMMSPFYTIFRLERVKRLLKDLGSSDAEISLTLIDQKKRELRDEMEKRKNGNILKDLIIDLDIKLELFDKKRYKELEEIRYQAIPAYVYCTKPIH